MEPLNRALRRFIPSRTGDAGPLGRLESAVMEAVWSQNREVSVADVVLAWPEPPAPAYNTVKTTMERLAEKEILSRRLRGKAYLYTSIVTREELERRIVATALDRLVEQFPEAVASFFVQPQPPLSQEQIALLREAVDRRLEDERG